MCDIQGFKAVNDNIDHLAGDDALLWYGNKLSAMIDQKNEGNQLFVSTPFRTGGDEVAAILELKRGRKKSDADKREFLAAGLAFVKELAEVHVTAPIPSVFQTFRL